MCASCLCPCVLAVGLSGVSGSVFVHETVRQLCIYHYTLSHHPSTLVWWQYVHVFTRDCSDTKKWIDTTCGENIITRLHINTTEIMACINQAPLKQDR